MSQSSATPAPDAIAVSPEVAATMFGMSRASWYALDSRGAIPRAIRPGGSRLPRWIVAELRAWAAAGCPTREQWERQRAKNG